MNKKPTLDYPQLSNRRTIFDLDIDNCHVEAPQFQAMERARQRRAWLSLQQLKTLRQQLAYERRMKNHEK